MLISFEEINNLQSLFFSLFELIIFFLFHIMFIIKFFSFRKSTLNLNRTTRERWLTKMCRDDKEQNVQRKSVFRGSFPLYFPFEDGKLAGIIFYTSNRLACIIRSSHRLGYGKYFIWTTHERRQKFLQQIR